MKITGIIAGVVLGLAVLTACDPVFTAKITGPVAVSMAITDTS